MGRDHQGVLEAEEPLLQVQQTLPLVAVPGGLGVTPTGTFLSSELFLAAQGLIPLCTPIPPVATTALTAPRPAPAKGGLDVELPPPQKECQGAEDLQ